VARIVSMVLVCMHLRPIAVILMIEFRLNLVRVLVRLTHSDPNRYSVSNIRIALAD
jgi:hypothetical protein